MPKPKWNLNTIYISERLQESLRPISRCALTTVVAPMGYGKTTALNWYLEQQAKVHSLRIIRISVYSDNLAIFWKSVQDAFARAGFDFLRDYTCPTDAAGGGMLADELCHELAGETASFPDCYHQLHAYPKSSSEGFEICHANVYVLVDCQLPMLFLRAVDLKIMHNIII